MPLLRTYPSLKIWIPGCSTGEEAYSLAILLREEGLLQRTLIYATDINAHALEKAQAGVYASNRISGFTENHLKSGARKSLSEYYTAAYGGAVFDKSLKQSIVFSDHSLATDSVFAEVQLVSCRNVLIYFNRELQDRAIGLFSEALCRKGFLGIGAKESLRFSSHSDAFVEVVRDDRIFQRREDVRMTALGSATRSAVDAVVIGASAGGVETLSVLLARFARSDCTSVFVVLHLPRERPSLLVEIFQPKCAVPVREAQDKDPVEPGHGLLCSARLPSARRQGARARPLADASRSLLTTLHRRTLRVRCGRLWPTSSRNHPERSEPGRRFGPHAVRHAGGITVVQRPESAHGLA